MARAIFIYINIYTGKEYIYLYSLKRDHWGLSKFPVKFAVR